MVRALGSRLAVKLALILVTVSAVGMLAMGLYTSSVLEAHSVENLKSSLATAARLIHDDILPLVSANTPSAQAQTRAGKYRSLLGARVTIIAASGTVLADSDRDLAGVGQMENHAGRPEVKVALSGGIGSDRRRSETVNVELLYVAAPLRDATGIRGVLRLAVPVTEVARTIASVRRTVLAGAGLALAVALAVGIFISRRVTRPVAEMRAAAHRMAEGDFSQRAPAAGRDEIAQLGRALNRMALSLNEKIEDLRREHATVEAILGSMVEGVIALDSRGRILLMNPGARAIFGLRREGVEGRPILEVVRHKEFFDLVETCRACNPGERCRREVELGPPIGRVLEAHATPVVFDPGGTGSLLVLHDITELRRLEQVRKEFVANVSHELRTPLTSIRGYLETLRDDPAIDAATRRRFIAVTQTHAQRLGRLVDDLLQLSDIETGKMILKPVPIRLHQVAQDMIAILESQATQKKLVLLNQVPPDLTVRADRDRLVQILVNLADNAIKYTPEGGRVTLGAAPAASGMVELWVMDTGIGIPSTDLPRITERFYRVDKARSRELGGTGLGLAIVKHLVQAHGADLRIESEVGKGTTIYLTFPGRREL